MLADVHPELLSPPVRPEDAPFAVLLALLRFATHPTGIAILTVGGILLVGYLLLRHRSHEDLPASSGPVPCARCGRVFLLPTAPVGSTVQCPHCGVALVAGAPAPLAATAPGGPVDRGSGTDALPSRGLPPAPSADGRLGRP